MKKLAIVGYRGMVGSVLVERMQACQDFKNFETFFFSTSQKGEKAPNFDNVSPLILDSNDINELSKMDIILSCQGGGYTTEVYPRLKQNGWNGFWVDAASTKRMDEDSLIVLDPINGDHIKKAIDSGIKNFVGGNCTVSLLLLALDGLLKDDLIEWITTMTYQAASGAGAQNMKELLAQMKYLGHEFEKSQNHSALEIEKLVHESLDKNDFPKAQFEHALALNVLPWIDSETPSGQSREELKAMQEAGKILNTKALPIDGTCVRVGSLRSHAQAVTIKLKKNISIQEIEEKIKNSHEWIHFVENKKASTLKELTPAFVSGTLKIAVGRVRKMNLGEEYLNLFTVGDQLLWGAAEPLRRMLDYLK